MKHLLLLLLFSSPAFAQMPPYLALECQVYDRICPEPQGNFCRGYEGVSVGGQFPTTFELYWSPPATGCLASFSFCAAHVTVPPVGEALFYYVIAQNSVLGRLPECSPVPPAPGSGEACAYTSANFAFHVH